MYSVNGVELNNPTLGWIFRRGSTPVSSLQFTATDLELPGRDGVTTFPTTRRPAAFSITIRSKLSSRSALLDLMAGPVLDITTTKKPGLVAKARTISSSVDQYHDVLGWAEDTFVIEVPSGSWRDVTETTSTKLAAVPTTATQNIYPNISAPVQDAVVRFQGPMQEPQLMDSSGSFVVFNATIASGQYVRFESASGRAWLTTSDTWSGGEEVSGYIDFNGPRGRFEITPNGPLTGARTGKISLTQASYNTGAGVQVRGKAAYLY